MTFSNSFISKKICFFIQISRKFVMMTLSNGNIFRVTGHLCGEFTGPRWIPRTKASDAELFFYLRLNKRLSKQSLGWWFETLSRPLWRHCNGSHVFKRQYAVIGSGNGLAPNRTNGRLVYSTCRPNITSRIVVVSKCIVAYLRHSV